MQIGSYSDSNCINKVDYIILLGNKALALSNIDPDMNSYGPYVRLFFKSSVIGAFITTEFSSWREGWGTFLAICELYTVILTSA